MKKYEIVLETIGFKKLEVPETYFYDIYVFGSIMINRLIAEDFYYDYNASFQIEIFKEEYLETGEIFNGFMKVEMIWDKYVEDIIDISRNNKTSKAHLLLYEQDVIDSIFEYKELKSLYRKNKIKKLLEI